MSLRDLTYHVSECSKMFRLLSTFHIMYTIDKYYCITQDELFDSSTDAM